MALIGAAAVAIWHDLLPEATEQFHQWHNREHMPERVAIPGFNRGRRYRAVGPGALYFNIYEAETLAILGGADYLERLNHPTPWTRETVASFRDVVRLTCRVRWSRAVGDGGFVRTIRFDDAGALAPLAAEVLPPLAALPGIAGVHLLEDDGLTSAIQTNERAARAEALEITPHAVLIEGVSPEVVAAAGERASAGLASMIAATYVLEHATEPAHARRAD